MASSDHEHPPPADTEEALLDVSLRFLVNLPEDEPPSVDRLFFQLQQAHWYYQDFLVDKFDHIDSLQFWEFCKMLFHRNPMLKGYSSRYGQYLRAFKHYVTQIPVYGGILLDKSLKQVLLVRSYRGKSWMFPRGKVNQGEEELDCAVREVEEETSFDMRRHVQSTAHAVEITSGGQKATYFVAVGVPKDFDFAPATRFEVSECRWWKLKDIPAQRGDKGYNRFWSIRRLLQPLKHDPRRRGRPRGRASPGLEDWDDELTAEETGLGRGGWSIDDMFQTNAELTGATFVYDGDPQSFGDEAVRPAGATAVGTRHGPLVGPLRAARDPFAPQRPRADQRGSAQAPAMAFGGASQVGGAAPMVFGAPRRAPAAAAQPAVKPGRHAFSAVGGALEVRKEEEASYVEDPVEEQEEEARLAVEGEAEGTHGDEDSDLEADSVWRVTAAELLAAWDRGVAQAFAEDLRA